MKYEWNIDKIREIVQVSINLSEVLEKLKIPRQGNNCKTLKKILDSNNIDNAPLIQLEESHSSKVSVVSSNLTGST